ncbi:MAG: hemolysin III family protein [Saprospiraceae bacterium]|nr:hemolysin III family protein [Saprospiraceae bacterium]
MNKYREPSTDYGRQEQIHFLSHLVGVLFIVCFGPILLLQRSTSDPLQIGLLIYVVSFAMLFAASSIYHYIQDPGSKKIWRRVDHMAIYLFIAGTNAPLLLGYANHGWGWILLAIMYGLVFGGIIWKVISIRKDDWISLVLYVLMGWMGVFTIALIFDKMYWITFVLILIGGLLYTIGTYFYRHDHRMWYHTIWHAFVLVAALAHFGAIFYQIST